MEGNLTDAAIRAAKPGARLSDNTGLRGAGRLMLVVTEGGRRTWHYRTQSNGKDITRKIGEYPTVSLADARKLAVTLGARPDQHSSAASLGELINAYLASLRARGAYSADYVESILRLGVPDSMRKREARLITAHDIHTLLVAKHDGGRVTVQVNRLRSALSACFSYAKRADYDPRRSIGLAKFFIESNPVAGTVPVAEWEQTRDRVLTQQEIADYYTTLQVEKDRLITQVQSLRDQFGNQVDESITRLEALAGVRALYQINVLTGQRIAQLMRAELREVEGKPCLVMIDTKGRGSKARRHVIPATPLIEQLWGQAKVTRNLDATFVRSTANTVLERVTKGAPTGKARPSDVRRTVETAMQPYFDRSMRSELLSHGRDGSVQAVHYERHLLLDSKRTMLDWMQAYVLGPDEPTAAAPSPAPEPQALPDNVIALRPAKTARG